MTIEDLFSLFMSALRYRVARRGGRGWRTILASPRVWLSVVASRRAGSLAPRHQQPEDAEQQCIQASAAAFAAAAAGGGRAGRSWRHWRRRHRHRNGCRRRLALLSIRNGVRERGGSHECGGGGVANSA